MATIEFDPANELLTLRGAGPALRHPFLSAFARKTRGSVVEGDRLEIPLSEDQLTDTYQTLVKLLAKLNISVDAGAHVSSALDEVRIAEENFATFSRHAQEIWSAQIDTDEFSSFVDTVERFCPNRTFYRKQLLSAFHLAFSQNACNFSVPGAGKTSVVYAAYSYLRSLAPDDPKFVDRLLIVGPLSCFKAWEDEYEEIFGEEADARRIAGNVPMSERQDHLRGISVGSRSVELTLTTYATLANMEQDFRTFLTNVSPRTMIILDEAHYIKSADGLQASAALRLAPLGSSRVVLTGTPAPNGYEDLANLFRFIYPSRNVVGFPTASLRAMTDGTMASAVPELKSRIQPYYTRIRKADLSLPPASEERVFIRMDERQEAIYRNLESRIVPHLRQAFDTPSLHTRVRARLIRLRQAAVNPALLLRPIEQDDGIFESADLNIAELEVCELIKSYSSQSELMRLQKCRELVVDILEEQGKVLIWSYFLGNLDLLVEEFRGTAGFVEKLTGATKVSGSEDESEPELGTREDIIDRFHSIDQPAILIANPQAVGESISLHKACRSAIYFDRDFNAGRFIQSKDRIHRYNPDGGEAVKYFHLISERTVDQDIDTRLAQKERRLSDLVDSEEIPLLTASEDSDLTDLREIFEAYERRKAQ